MFINSICANQQRPMYFSESTLPKFGLLSNSDYFMPRMCLGLCSKHKVSSLSAHSKLHIIQQDYPGIK